MLGRLGCNSSTSNLLHPFTHNTTMTTQELAARDLTYDVTDDDMSFRGYITFQQIETALNRNGFTIIETPTTDIKTETPTPS